MLSLEEAQELHRLIGGAIEDVAPGTHADDELRRARELAAILVSDALVMADKPAVIINGNFAEGFTFHGPYASFDEAADSKEGTYIPETWIASLIPPSKG